MSDLIIPVNDEPHIPVETTNKDDNSKPHNGNPITKIEISPNGNYLVTYSEKDKSFVGWNVGNIKDNGQLKPDNVYNIEKDHEVYQICVSDDRKLAYIYYSGRSYLKIIDMNNNNQEINLDFDKHILPYYCTFNLKGEFILYSITNFSSDDEKKIIFIYSTKTKNNKWICKKIYKLPDDVYLISISKYDKFYFISNDDYCFYEWDILTEKSIKIFGNNEYVRNIRISSNGKFICLKTEYKIIIYSIELETPIVSLNYNDTQPYNFMNYIDSDLYFLLLTLFNTKLFNDEQMPSTGIWNPIMEYYCKEYLPKEYQTENLLIHPFLFDNTKKFVYRILNGYIWKIKIENIFKIRNELDEVISEMIENSDELNKLNNENDIIKSWNIYLDMDNECDDQINNPHVEQELTLDSKLKVNIDDEKIQLQVFKKNDVNNIWDLICISNDEHDTKSIEEYRILGIKLYNNNDIIILTTIGLFIYNFNESNKSISLNLFYHIILNQKIEKELRDYYKIVSSKPSLPLSSNDKYGIDKYNEWASPAKDNKLSLLKYSVELLSFAIKEHKLELIDDIYKKCTNYFKQDLLNNRTFLSIITSTMPMLNKYYPEYYPECILRYSLETTMIVDSHFYSIGHHEHLYSFSQYPQIVNLSRSKYTLYFNNRIILKCIRILIVLLTFPISKLYFYIFYKISATTITITITFMVPYIKFVNYPQHYNWFFDFIRPQSSPFVKTISRDIYKTWDGEALINFKWNTYGKYYYAIIWIMFIALFGCFITAANIPFAENVRNKLLIASIILGFIHLIIEIRQIIYDFNKWIRDLWNIFDIIAYLLPICTSVYWLQTSDINDQIIRLLSFSCLFLYIKFVMFFRAFDAFGVYFAIIFNVGKKIFSFLVVLLIIIMGFANAFYILLLPRSINDPNSPLNMATIYKKVDNGTIDSNPFMIQSPNDNTNMFTDYRTAILALYFFLTGDSSSLTNNWSYIENPTLVILIFFFSFLVVVYFMNLFIGLLNLAIDIDNDRVSYLMQKAEILAEIELFYLLPNQRRWQEWFPDTIYYYASVDKTREKVKKMIYNGEWKANDFSQMKRNLLNKLDIQHNLDN